MVLAGRAQLGALVGLGLGWHGAGHGCGDGRPMACTVVQSNADAPPSSYGVGYAATGFPFCTPEGKKVMCLVDHDFHRCPEGKVPCCQDGSNPTHSYGGGNTTGSDDSIVCTPVVLAISEAPVLDLQIVLDDMDDGVETEARNMFPGTYDPCLEDAYNRQFHHDLAENKGHAHFSITFDPPRSGCYSIEEHHPGSNWQCARYLPRNAQLDVDYCRGKTATVAINQASRGGRWNKLGMLPFYEGFKGRFTLRSSEQEQCSERSCNLVADAFRLKWLGESCPAPAAEAVEEQEAALAEAKGEVEPGIQLVLDDADTAVETEARNMSEGTYEPCLRDAFDKQFHHDGAENKGGAHFSITFDPPKSGCYSIEEHHPGSSWQCARNLPENARLDIEYCKGKSSTVAINQARRGGQWNMLGRLPFYEGTKGKFTLRSTEEERCGEPPCVLVADAFRLTWLGASCSVSTTPAVQEEEEAALAEATAEGPRVQLLLDDMDKDLRTEAHNTYKGTYGPCLQDAYNEQFHHDEAKNKGNAHFSVAFDPPKSGCYAIEEHHPGSNPLCARYLPRNARLDVNYCKGKLATVAVNQAENGAQWNKLGAVMFYKGVEGKFTLRNSQEEQCSEPPCFLVADAFRLTWLGEDCSSTSEPEEREGVLAFRARLSHGGTASDLQEVLDAHHNVFEAALTAHYGYEQIQVLEVVTVAGRRLHHPEHEGQVVGVEVRFLAYGPAVNAVAGDLTKRLQVGLARARVDVELEAAAVEWTASLPRPGLGWRGRHGGDCGCRGQRRHRAEGWAFALAATLSVSALALCMAGWCVLKGWQSSKAKVVVVEDGPAAKELDAESKAQVDLEVASVSTGAPDDVSEGEDGCRSQGSRPSTPGHRDLSSPAGPAPSLLPCEVAPEVQVLG